MFFDQIKISRQSQNRKWRELFESKSLSVKPLNISREADFYCIGSCFAEYVRTSLEKFSNRKCLPTFQNLEIDDQNELVDTLHLSRFHMNYYSSASILQEFERSWYQSRCFAPIKISDVLIEEGKKTRRIGASCYQDPYRREVFANSESQIISLSSKISSCVRAGLSAANCFIVTLGLVEIFRSKTTGLVFNQFPGYGGIGYSATDLEFVRQSASEVESDLRELIKLIKLINKENQIVFSVSPVPLQMTFTESDVFVANLYSKSTLRTAVEQVLDPVAGIHYYPSYEIAMNLNSDFFQSRDLRHARKENVDRIVESFLACLQ